MAVDTEEFYVELQNNGFDFFTGVPDSLLKSFCGCVFDKTPKDRNIIAANEGSAFAMACGYHISSQRYGVVYMQNSGMGNVINPLLSLADSEVYSIPLLMIIGWRGRPGEHDEPQHVKQGKVTCDILDMLGVPYFVLDESEWRTQLHDLASVMKKDNRAVALVIKKGTFGDYPFCSIDASAQLTREEALEIILDRIHEDDFVVSTTGKTSREVFEMRERHGQRHCNDFLTVGSMGHTGSLAFGMALGTTCNIWCIDGDGSFLMHMGSIPVIAQNAPSNFRYILNNNGAHESVGGQPTIAQDIDVVGILRASGFEYVFEAKDKEEITRALDAMKELEKSALVLTTHQGSREDLGRPTIPPIENKIAMMSEFQQKK